MQAGFHRLCLGSTQFGLTADTVYGSASTPLVNISTLDPTNVGSTYSIRIRFNDTVPVAPAVNPYPNPTTDASFSYYLYVPPGQSTATKWEEVRRYANIPGAIGCKLFASSSVANRALGYLLNYDPANSNGDPDLTGSGATVLILLCRFQRLAYPDKKALC